MATEINLQTKIDTANSAQSLGEIRKSLKELISLQGQVGAGSAEFKKLTKAINDTEGKLGDLNDSFNTLRGSGVERLNASFGLLREGFANADIDKVGIAFKGLGAAMKAVPIFLLAEGVKLLVENFSDIIKFFGIGAKESDKLTASLEKQKKVNESLFAVQENQIKIMQAEGKSIDEVTKATKALNDQKIQAAKNDIELQKLKIREIFLNDSLTESLQRTGAQVLRAQGNTIDADRIEAKIAQDKLKRANEIGEQIRTDLVTINNLQTDSKIAEINAEKKHTQDLKKINEERAAELLAQRLENIKRAKEEEAAIELQTEQAKGFDKVAEAQLTQDELNAIKAAGSAYEEQLNIDTKARLDKIKEQERIDDITDAQKKVRIAQDVNNSIQSLSDIAFTIKSANTKKGTKEEEAAARQQFKINKALALTGAIMNGAQSVLAITSVPDFTLGIATAIRIGAQILTTASVVAKIASTQFTATNSGGVGSGATSSAGAGASIAPPSPQSLAFNQNTVGSVGAIGGNQAKDTRVVLVSHDVTRAQKNDKIIEMQATFG